MVPLWFTLTSVALIAACIGSLCTVVIDRLPVALDEPNEFGDLWDTRPWREVLGGRSRCSSCGEPVKAYENIPVLAYLALRGRCRHCHARIPLWVLAVEVAVPALAVWAVWAQGWTWTTAPTLLLVVVGVIVAAIDLRTLIVPTRLVWPAFAVAVAGCIAIALGLGEAGWLVSAVIGVATFAGPLFVLWWLHPRGMGFGDVRLAVLLGWIIGFEAGPGGHFIAVYGVIVAFVLSSFLGILLGVVSAMAQVRALRKVPFGPTLAAGSFLVCLGIPEIRRAFGR